MLWFRPILWCMQFPALQNILWTAAAYNKIRPRAVVFPSSEPRARRVKKVKLCTLMIQRRRSWGGELRWGFIFTAIPLTCALDLLWLKRKIRDSLQFDIIYLELIDFSFYRTSLKATNHAKIVFRMGWENIKIHICGVSAPAGQRV